MTLIVCGIIALLGGLYLYEHTTEALYSLFQRHKQRRCSRTPTAHACAAPWRR